MRHTIPDSAAHTFTGHLKDVVPLSTPFDHVVRAMLQCQCTIVLGFPQIRIETGKIKGRDIDKGFSLPTEWNQIEAAMSICSSYGNADAKIIKDTRGVNFLILKTAQGRGTHVTTEYLTVYRIEDAAPEDTEWLPKEKKRTILIK